MTEPTTPPAGNTSAPPARVHRPPVRRFSTSVNPDAHGLSSLDPVMTRKGGKLAHKSVLLLVVAGLLFMAYAFNVGNLQTTLDGMFDSVNHSAQSQSNIVVSTIIAVAPYVAAVIAGFIILFLVRGMFRGVKSAHKSRKLACREEITVDEFLTQTAEHGVGPKVAREAYQLLKPHYKDCMRAHLTDNLNRDVHLDAHDVVNLRAALLTKADRHRKALHTGPVPETVLDLLLSVENAPVRAAMAHPPLPPKGVRLASFVRPKFKQPQ